MRDLAFVAFFFGLIALGFRRPFLFVLAYVYVDIVAPQRLSYYLLNSVPVSMICALLAVGGWALADDKSGTRMGPRHLLIVLLLAWAAFTTAYAAVPEAAPEKWGWVWKALAFAIFLPLTLRTRLRIEGLLLFMILSAASIVIVGGIKTLASGGGYGALNLMVSNNSGLYEGSTISTVAIAMVPLILYLGRYGTVFPSDWRVRTFAYALVFACLLIPIGTEARTGLICIGLLGVLMLRATKRRFLYLVMVGVAGMAAVPLLPSSFTERMDTIQGYKADSSASTRLAVWGWTWDYVRQHPLGGGFEVYLLNTLRIEKVATERSGGTEKIETTHEFDKGRAFHSAYFEMLGEQGFPGFFLWLALHVSSLFRMEVLRRRYLRAEGDRAWIAPLATALQHGQIIYMVGSLFVGIAFQPFILMLIGVQIGLDSYLTRRFGRRQTPFGAVPTEGAAPPQANPGWQ
ncbi:MAG: putative O-glycosylation ligase, exosortase system-associated [Sphingomonas bacterium]|nr:putative O-glycosylation ligase, exosortase A system-associated [Sphingomonas bacterium]MDB5688520.1 putative O-glycosylation ligase, exosortase system-associated [Sphingomonas bacterium]